MRRFEVAEQQTDRDRLAVGGGDGVDDDVFVQDDDEDGDAEAEFVVESILASREEGLELQRQAVLFRGSHHSDRLEIELVRRNIPYVKYGGLKFLEAAHVKDVLAILKWAENPKNEVAAFRVLRLLPGMGPANAARCFELLAVNDHAFSALANFRPPAGAAPG